MSFTAKYESDCDNCDEPIKAGDRAIVVNYEQKAFAHVTCSTPIPGPVIEVVCSKCFLIHAGECF